MTAQGDASEPEVAAYYAQRWQNLQHLDSMIDHWYWRPGWHVGRSFYTWHITFENAPEVQRLADFYQQRITLAFLDPVPLRWLHLTMQGIGFTDEVSDDDIQAIVAATRHRCSMLAPFALRLGPLDADPQGAPLEIHPWRPVVELRRTVRDAIADIWGPDRVPEPADGFCAHVTVFYSNTSSDPRHLRAALAELRDTPPVETVVGEVSLIKLERDQKIYQWETVARIPLSAT